MSQINREDGNEDEDAYTYDEAVELTGHGRYNYLLLVTCCIISKGIGMDMFGFAIIVTVAKCDLQMGITECGVLASAPFAGVLFTYPVGYYADTRGRKPALLLSSLSSFVFASLSSFSPSWQLMMVLKVISSGFSSASFVLINTIIGECTGSTHRNKYIFIINSMDLISDSISFALAYFLLPLEFNYPMTFMSITFRPWRLLTLIMALPFGIAGLMMLFLHESPKFLASRGDYKRSLEVLRSIYKRNGGKEDEFRVVHLKITDTMDDKKISWWKSLRQQTALMFQPRLLWRTLQLTYLLVVCVSTNSVFVMWFPEIINIFFNELSGAWDTELTFCNRLFPNEVASNYSIMDTATYVCDDTLSQYGIYSGIIYSLLFGILTLVFSRMAAYRRTIFILSLVISCLSCVLVDLYQPVASVVFFVMIQCSALGLPSLLSYLIDLYPTSCRGTASSIGMTVTRLCSLAAVNLVGAVITDYCSLTFYAWAAFVFSGVVLALFLPSDKR